MKRLIAKFRKFIKGYNEFQVLNERPLLIKPFLFLYRILLDSYRETRSKSFNEYGMTTFTGRQGSGKTMSMVVELERIRRDYPEVKIMTNFGYIHEDEKKGTTARLFNFF